MKFGIFYEHQLPRPCYAHQNEDIVRLTPDELKRKMAAKEAAKAATQAR
jgi:predicted solute-binding protein